MTDYRKLFSLSLLMGTFLTINAAGMEKENTEDLNDKLTYSRQQESVAEQLTKLDTEFKNKPCPAGDEYKALENAINKVDFSGFREGDESSADCNSTRLSVFKKFADSSFKSLMDESIDKTQQNKELSRLKATKSYFQYSWISRLGSISDERAACEIAFNNSCYTAIKKGYRPDEAGNFYDSINKLYERSADKKKRLASNALLKENADKQIEQGHLKIEMQKEFLKKKLELIKKNTEDFNVKIESLKRSLQNNMLKQEQETAEKQAEQDHLRVAKQKKLEEEQRLKAAEEVEKGKQERLEQKVAVEKKRLEEEKAAAELAEKAKQKEQDRLRKEKTAEDKKKIEEQERLRREKETELEEQKKREEEERLRREKEAKEKKNLEEEERQEAAERVEKENQDRLEQKVAAENENQDRLEKLKNPQEAAEGTEVDQQKMLQIKMPSAEVLEKIIDEILGSNYFSDKTKVHITLAGKLLPPSKIEYYLEQALDIHIGLLAAIPCTTVMMLEELEQPIKLKFKLIVNKLTKEKL